MMSAEKSLRCQILYRSPDAIKKRRHTFNVCLRRKNQPIFSVLRRRVLCINNPASRTVSEFSCRRDEMAGYLNMTWTSLYCQKKREDKFYS